MPSPWVTLVAESIARDRAETHSAWNAEVMNELPNVWGKLEAQLQADLDDFHQFLPRDAPTVTAAADDGHWKAMLNQHSVEAWMARDTPEIFWKGSAASGALVLYGTRAMGFFLAVKDGPEVLKGLPDAAEKILIAFLREAYRAENDGEAASSEASEG